MADEKTTKEQRYSSVYVENQIKEIKDRTCAVYTVSDNVGALDELARPKPENANEINISWIDSALQQALFENKYSAWDLIEFPAGLWVASAYGNGISAVAGADGKIAIKNNDSQLWEEKTVIDELSCIAYGDNRFIALSSSGQGIYSDDDGNTWQALTVPAENYSGLAYSNGNFIAITSTGKVFYSNDKGINWNEVNTGITSNFTTIATDGMSKVVILGNTGEDRCLYSTNNGKSYKVISIASNSWTSIVYGENMFIACSNDGANRLAKFNINTEQWIYNNVSQKEWRSVSYGARVFTCLAVTGEVISSTDGVRWLEVPAHNGDWNNILRTDYFFIAFSSADNPQGLNAMRSSNGGILGIDFATLDEVINNEFVQKAINPNVLIEYLNYRTGKNNGQYPVYEDNKYIDCISEKSKSILIQYINTDSAITSLDEITVDGYYFISKDLLNKPDDKIGSYFLKVVNITQNNITTVIQYLYENDFNSNVYYVRSHNGTWSDWELVNILQSEINNIDLSGNNISVTQNNTYSACNTLLMTDENSKVVNVDKSTLKISNAQVTGLGDLATQNKEDLGLGALAEKDKANLTTDVVGVLPPANGGLGTNNVNIARENLEVLRYKYNEEDKNLTNAPTGFATYFLAEDVPKYVASNCHTFTLYHSGSPVKGYAMQYYIGADNFSLFGRKRLGTEPGYQGWKKLRNPDGTIPFELGGVLNTYTTSDGQWTETLLSTGEIMLEGWGKVEGVISKGTEMVSLPKNININKSYRIFAHELISSTSYTNVVNIFLSYELMRLFFDNPSTRTINFTWEFKGILA